MSEFLHRNEIIKALEELGKRHPQWRFGQLVVNVSIWARELRPAELWNVEDEDFLEAIKTHWEQQLQSSKFES